MERGELRKLPSASGVNRNPVWTPDEQRLVTSSTGSGGPLNLYWQPADGSGHPTKLTVFLDEPLLNEQQPSFSPDGHWLAYESNQSGHFEVSVVPFPGPGGKIPFLDGRRSPNAVWSHNRRELLDPAPDGRISTVVPYTATGAFRVEKPLVSE